MKFEEIRVIAKSMGIKTARMRKADTIRAIQQAEGNFACFDNAADGCCDQWGCAWRKDCMPEPAENRPPE
jgi:hypothetical protein